MRTLLLIGWLMVPVVFGAWHYGPGQEQLKLDDVSRSLAAADRHAAAEEWAEAAAKYDEAIKLLPPERASEARRIRLERAKAQMLSRQLPAAYEDLQALVEEVKSDPKADAKFVAEARAAYANSQYYLTWLLRLEGEPKELWEPEIESARQTYRLLAEQADVEGDATSSKKHREDLEATIRLARMDLSDLQGLPLPSQ